MSRLLTWARDHRRTVGLLGAVAAAGMTALWVVVVPDRAAETSGPRSWAITWGHPASWACLAAAGVAVALDAPRRATTTLAWTALACYAAFLLALLL